MMLIIAEHEAGKLWILHVLGLVLVQGLSGPESNPSLLFQWQALYPLDHSFSHCYE